MPPNPSQNSKKTLLEKGHIGLHIPQALLNKMWLHNTKMFGLRGSCFRRKFLENIDERITTRANIFERKTNHSTSIVPTTIQQLSVNKDVESVMKYATASLEMQ